MVSRSRRVTIASLLGVATFLAKGFLPSPYADFLVIFEALFVGLGYALLGRGGATYVEGVNGVLLTIVKLSFAPFSLLLALLFGVQVDAFSSILRVKNNSDVQTTRLAAALTISTGTTGVIAYYTTAIVTKLVPADLGLGLTILVFGILSGAAGGYLAARLWNRNLKPLFTSTTSPNE